MEMALIIFFYVRGGGRGGKNTTAEKYSHVISWHDPQQKPELPTAWTNVVLWSSLINHDTRVVDVLSFGELWRIEMTERTW